MCNTAAYALCIKAPCAKKSEDDKHVQCECIMQSGWNMGPNSCEDRAKSLTSTYSNNFNPYSATVRCPAGPWAWCYGATCVPDPNDPSKAICNCPVITKTAYVVLVNRELCRDPGQVCGMLWSAAAPPESEFANNQIYSWMTDSGMMANPPAPACPAPK